MGCWKVEPLPLWTDLHLLVEQQLEEDEEVEEVEEVEEELHSPVKTQFHQLHAQTNVSP